MKRLTFVLLLALITACDSGRPVPTPTRGDGTVATDLGGGGDAAAMDGNEIDGGDMDSGQMDAMAVGNIPDPPMASAAEWPDVEPNDSPDRAVPVGAIDFALWMGFSQPINMINSNTDVDFYVFRTGSTMPSLDVFMQICWGGNRNLLDMYLHRVVDRTQGALVRGAETTNTSCETLIAMGEGATLLATDSIYLLEIRAAPGLDLMGGDGMYNA